MIHSSSTPDDLDTVEVQRATAEQADHVEQIVRSGPRGAIALASTTTAIVFALWFAFYFLVFLPRGVIQ